MNWFAVIIAAGVLGAMFALKRAACVSAATAERLLRGGATIVDVRSAGEFARDGLPGAINIPLEKLADEFPRRIPQKDRALLLHCLSGTRSAIAARRLGAMGYRNVFNLGSYGRARKLIARANAGRLSSS